jgi:nicotinamide-nucleotide amidase
MRATQISVGNELLIGETVNTNAAWIGSWLTDLGITCHRVLTVGDDPDAIRGALDMAFSDSQMVVLTGGLGPTHDDVTKTTVAAYFDVGLVRHEPSYQRIRRLFHARGIPFSASNETQSDLPANAEALPNSQGTAPGFLIRHNGSVLAVMPGVPREMMAIFTEELTPRLVSISGAEPLIRHHVQVAGIGESTLSDLVIGDVSPFLVDGVQLAYLPHTHGTTLRVSHGPDGASSAGRLLAHIRTMAHDHIVGEGADASLERCVVEALRSRALHLATAESCTGGWIANLVTNVPGSSAVFKGGIVAYDNSIKTDMLDVPATLLAEHGAVSKPVALHMARMVAMRMGADIGISTTGIAGPDGGTPDKPVGLVWIGYWSEARHFAVKARFFRDRKLNKERSAVTALDIVRRQLADIRSMPFDLDPES